MRAPYTRIYLHVVWATWDRLPLIAPLIKRRLYGSMMTKLQELNCVLMAAGGIEDHIHLVVQMPTTVSVAQLVQETKGASSHAMTHVIQPQEFFKWQGGYGAFSISESDLTSVIAYVRNQEQHHTNNTTHVAWERTEIPVSDQAA